MVEVIAAKRRISARGQHFEDALVQAQDGDIESAAAQVINGVQALGALIEAIGHGGGSRLVEETQQLQARQLGGILGRLPLGFIEISGHRDHRAGDFAAQRGFGTGPQHGKDVCRHLHRTFFTGGRDQIGHAPFSAREAVGQFAPQPLHIGNAAPHQALDGNDGVERIFRRRRPRLMANATLPIRKIANHGGQQVATGCIRQGLGLAALHRGHQRVGRAEIDAHGQPVLVRRGTLAGLGNLQQRHQSPSSSVSSSSRRASALRTSSMKRLMNCILRTVSAASLQSPSR